MSSTPTFLASGFGGTVASVGVVSNRQDFFIMDDVTYGKGGAVPEPGSIALLLGPGAVGSFVIARRKLAKK